MPRKIYSNSVTKNCRENCQNKYFLGNFSEKYCSRKFSGNIFLGNSSEKDCTRKILGNIFPRKFLGNNNKISM